MGGELIDRTPSRLVSYHWTPDLRRFRTR
jgi:hypothetical protein